MLNIQTYSKASQRPTLLIAHGLFGSGRNWRAIAKRLSQDRQVVTVDMRNHGGSFWHESQTYADMAEDLAVVDEFVGAPVDVLGHSMGGKAAMVFALTKPEHVSRLLVADIAPRAYAHSQISNVELMQGLDIQSLNSRSEADTLLKNDLPEPEIRAFLLQSLVLSSEGNRWQLNLPALASNMSDIIGFPTVTGSYSGPSLFIRGGVSEYVKPAYQPEIHRLFPNASIRTIEGSGHWVHAEAPRRFLEMVFNFLADQG